LSKVDRHPQVAPADPLQLERKIKCPVLLRLKMERCTRCRACLMRKSALDPIVTANTLGHHYGKHHEGYVDNLNKLIARTQLANLSLEKLIIETTDKADKVAIFNNAAQTWNHSFYWRSLRPKGGGEPPRR
jgi:superoxide dismutase